MIAGPGFPEKNCACTREPLDLDAEQAEVLDRASCRCSRQSVRRTPAPRSARAACRYRAGWGLLRDYEQKLLVWSRRADGARAGRKRLTKRGRSCWPLGRAAKRRPCDDVYCCLHWRSSLRAAGLRVGRGGMLPGGDGLTFSGCGALSQACATTGANLVRNWIPALLGFCTD
jgi:hypothetical protein